MVREAVLLAVTIVLIMATWGVYVWLMYNKDE